MFAEKANSPGLFCQEPVYQFGKISGTESVQHNFRVENRSSAPLTVEKIRTTCSCVRAEVNNKTLASGGSTEIQVVFTPDERRGRMAKSIYIGYGSNSWYKLVLEGMVLEE